MFYIFINTLVRLISFYIIICKLVAKTLDMLKGLISKARINKQTVEDIELKTFRRQLDNFGKENKTLYVPLGFKFLHPLSVYQANSLGVCGNSYWVASVIISRAYLSRLRIAEKNKVKSNLAELLSEDFTIELDKALEQRSLRAIYEACTLITLHLEEKLLNQ